MLVIVFTFIRTGGSVVSSMYFEKGRPKGSTKNSSKRL